MESVANKSFTIDEKRAHVLAYMKSKLTQQEYCKRNDLKVTSFKNWTAKYRRKRESGFVPVDFPPKSQAIPPQHSSAKQSHIEIIKDNCKIVLCNVVNVATAVEIIRGVLSCS